jgi:serine/threonine protein kinase/predicted Zn-dependent protease
MATIHERPTTIDELAEEFLVRLRSGDRPALSEYTRRHPELADEIREIFPALVMMEEARPANGFARLGNGLVDAQGRQLERLNDYRIIREIGHGGMGVVYEAEQEAIGRRVALKVLPIRAGTDPKCLLRFRREARSAGRLHHTNIVPVFDVGHHDSVHYYSMQFIQGRSLDEVIGDLRRPNGNGNGSLSHVEQSSHAVDRSSIPRPFSEQHHHCVARIGLQVASALDHAHSQNVLHRDIKPSNLLLDDQGTIWVTDFGLAKADGDDLTKSGDIVGTLRYMAPERFDGISTPRSDIYSLGLTLYELLTLRPAFDETDRAQLIQRLRQVDPPLPRVFDPGVPRDLETILLTAISKEPARRYMSAAELAEDLRRFLADLPIHARRTSRSERVYRMCRRNPVLAGLVAALALTLLIGFAGVLWKWRDAERARAREHDARIGEQAAVKLAQDRADEVRVGLERLKAANGLLDRGREYARQLRWDDAHAAFTQAIELRPDHASAWVERSELYTRLGLFDLAAADYAREIELREPETSFRWYQHALLRLYVGDTPGYRDACRRMLSRFRGTLQSRSAEEVFRSNLLAANAETDLPQMLESLERIVLHQPASSLYVLGLAHYRAGAYESAIQRLHEGLAAPDRWPLSSLSYATLAMAYHRQGRSAEARQALEEMAKLLDSWTRDRYESGSGKWIIHQGAIGFWPVYWWDYLEGQLLYREAKRLMDGAEPPDDARLHVLRARSIAGLRWSTDAAKEYEIALKLSPDEPQIQQELFRARGYSFVGRRQWDSAAEQFAKACELQPDDAYLWRILAMAYFAANDLDSYRRTCLAMYERFKDTADGTTAANVLLSCELADDAIPDVSRLLPLTRVAEPLWHWGAWTRGAALYRTGRYEESIECFQSASQTFRPRAWDWCFLAMAHSRLGHAGEARRCLAEAAEWIRHANQKVSDDLSVTRPNWGEWHEPIVALRLLDEARLLAQETFEHEN